MPSIVPVPRGYGKCLDTDGHFFICDYLEIDHCMPNEAKLAESISELHRTSASPTGQFGFHVTTYDGKLPLVTKWDSNWVSFYGKLLEGVYNLDIQANGHWTRLDDAMKLVLDKVAPRLLGRLYEDNRTVKPCLIHGDLWEQNIGTDTRTKNIYIFDACAYYAHHEMAIGMWRVNHHLMNEPKYRDSYFKLFERDEPVDEYDDRNRLYSLKEKIMYSAHVPDTEARGEALDDMLYLIDKYVDHE
jgi:fructosamine-3-kinase